MFNFIWLLYNLSFCVCSADASPIEDGHRGQSVLSAIDRNVERTYLAPSTLDIDIRMPAFFYSNKQQYIEMVKVPGRDLQIDQDLYLEFTLKKLIQSLDVVYGQCSLFSLTVSSPNTRPVSLNFSYLSVTNKNSLTAQKIERDREIRLIFDKNGIFSGLINRNGESIQEESVLLDQLSVLCDEEKKLFKLCSVALNLKPAAIDEHSVDKYRLIFKKNNFH